MNNGIQVRPARAAETGNLAQQMQQLPDLMRVPRPEHIEGWLKTQMRDRLVLVATSGTQLAGVAMLDLDHSRVTACCVNPDSATPDTPARLVEAIEHTALAFGLRRLHCPVQARAAGFVRALGYVEDAEGGDSDDELVTPMSRDLLPRASRAVREVIRLNDELGVPPDFGVSHRMRIVTEAEELVPIGNDMFDRPQQLTPAAADAWARMRAAAQTRGISLQVVSGFRSISYQARLLRRKLEQGQRIGDVLRTSAPPGFSEHHSGRALDLNSPGNTPLEQGFADSRAYQWLKTNARLFGFRESYPFDNRHRMAWEPWHWYFRPVGG